MMADLSERIRFEEHVSVKKHSTFRDLGRERRHPTTNRTKHAAARCSWDVTGIRAIYSAAIASVTPEAHVRHDGR